MNIISWEDDFALDIEEIDLQHKQLVGIANKYFDYMKEGKAFSAISEIVDELLAYGKYHFETEERYFTKFHYNLENEHCNEHIDFIKKVLVFKKAFLQGKTKLAEDSPVITVDLWIFLKAWLIDHIKNTDKKYQKLFKENGLN